MSNDKKTDKKQDKLALIKEIKDKKMSAESSVVLNIYKNTELYFDSDLTVDSFSSKVWRFYYAIAQKLILEGKRVLDDVTVGLYMETRKQSMKDLYEQYGGYETIQQGMEFVKDENFQSYENEIVKANTIIKLMKNGFDVLSDENKNHSSMSLEDIESYWETKMSSIFAETIIDEKIVDLKKGMMDVIDQANEGVHRGFPYHSPMLNKFANGQPLGNITMLSAGSGVGKTFFTIAQVMPTIIEYEETLCIMANEEDEDKWKTAILIYVVNNVLEESFNKSRMNEGSFTKEEYEILSKGADWIEEKIKDDTIRFVNFSSFSMKKAIKIIKKEKAIKGVKYFLLDTLKMDSDSKADSQVWLALQMNMVKLYDVIKKANLNVHVFVTYQLGKSSLKNRFLDQSSLGMSKNVVDVCSTVMIIRKALESEKEDGSNEVLYERGGVKRPLKKDKEYFILFFAKNRANTTSKQLVYEVDMGRNIVKDTGLCVIEDDF